MLMKRSRSHQKDQVAMSDSGSESYFQSNVVGNCRKKNSLFTAPGLFIGFSPKVFSDSDSVRSPTSPLDFRAFSNLGNPLRSPRSPSVGYRKNWDVGKVGLSIVDSLGGDDTKVSGKLLRTSGSKNILFGPRMRIKDPNFEARINSFESPKSLPKNYALFPQTLIKSSPQKGNSGVVFEIGGTPLEDKPSEKIRSCSLDSCRSFFAVPDLSNCNSNTQVSSSPTEHICPNSPFIGSGNWTGESLSASEIEFSEDYTRVISHGPNPKTTHIFGDCILECHDSVPPPSDLVKNEKEEVEILPPPEVKTSVTRYPSDDFLSFCYSCNKKLEGNDIYIYGGEKAFCSLNCRLEQIMIDEKMEKTNNKSSESSHKVADNDDEKLTVSTTFIATERIFNNSHRAHDW